jgi:hypothetical protein
MIRDATKTAVGCCRCGWNGHPSALDFAHRDRSEKYRRNNGQGRTKGIPQLISPATLKKEIDKCTVMCANCHALDTDKESKSGLLTRPEDINRRAKIQARRDIMNAEKLRRGGCIDCKLPVTADTYVIFDFDHIPGETKVDCVSAMTIKFGQYSLQQMVDEMRKCELRCKRCHRIKTRERYRSTRVGTERAATTETVDQSPSVPDAISDTNSSESKSVRIS